MLLRIVRVLLCFGISVFAIAQVETDPKAEAKAAVERFFEAWNTADIENVRTTLNYPHLTLFGSRMAVAQTPDQFETDFAGMRAREGWAKSTVDGIAYHTVSPEKVHCTVSYSRHNAAGERYSQGTTLYAMTNKDGHWGMQFRTPTTAGRDETAEAAARKLLDEFYAAFNLSDNSALQTLTNYPHAFITANGSVNLAESAETMVTNFDRMREQEGWHHSTLDSAHVLASSPEAVVFDIVFSRYKEAGLRYSTVPATWVVTNNDGHWGLQVRSLQPATFRHE